jgi:hypothetical protein
VNQWRYIGIAATALVPGNYFIGAFYSTSDDGLLGPGGFGGTNNFATDPNIVYVDSTYGEGTVLTFPDQSGGNTPQGYFGPNFQLQEGTAAVPEPGMLTIFVGIGLVAGSGIGYHKWKLSKNV